MLFSMCDKKGVEQNNIGGAILLGVEVGDGWFVTGNSLRSRRWAAVLLLYEHVRFTLYTVVAHKDVWRPQKLAPFT